MRFIDEVGITVTAGRGGDGRVSFRREKFIPKGGPDGGNGNHGGSIYFRASRSRNTLVHFRGKKSYQAEHGGDGGSRRQYGKTGEDLMLEVPVGTVIKNKETGAVLADLIKHNQQVLVARGGRGGLGNDHFKSSTNQAPRFATKGMAGQHFELNLELKLLADISLVGMPNVGKSTLIAVISRARPKIANYEFTTLRPNLGVVELGTSSFVVADIPGLIENASKGRGLGIRFLKHIERTRAFVHMVDISQCADTFEAFDRYTTVKNELMAYNQAMLAKKEIVCFSKTDAVVREKVQSFQDFFEETIGTRPLAISSASRQNIDRLKVLMQKSLSKGQNFDT